MITAYSPTDRPDCIRMFLDVYRGHPWNRDWLDEESVGRYFADIERTPCFNGFVFKAGDRMAGFCFGVTSDYFLGKSFEITEIVIARALQRQGAGSRFLALIEQRLIREGTTVVTLATEAETVAHSFYLKNNYHAADKAIYLYKNLNIQEG